jgi:hypothetical protein
MAPRSWSEALRDLREAERLARSAEATAPGAVALAGGGDELVRLYGSPTGAGFWRLVGLPEELWCAMAAEHAEAARAPSSDG